MTTKITQASKQTIRECFRNAVYTRDNHTCVVPGCGEPAVDAHHIIERALWRDRTEVGGYLVDNGVSVCELHHHHAERDWIPPQALRFWAGIDNRVLPGHLDPDRTYTKWGAEVRHPTRNSWELIKYPHTPFSPNSPSIDEVEVRDRGYSTIECLMGKPLLSTLKMDGSCALLVDSGVGARNATHAEHRSFDLLKQQHQQIRHLIPRGVQIFGEWMYARHSIHYVDELALDSYFQVFAVYYRNHHLWLGWDGVETWAKRLGFPTVPVLGRYVIDNMNSVYTLLDKLGNWVTEQGHEGIVIRSVYPFYYGQFKDNVAKWVRPNHVQTNAHWSKQKIVRNELKNQ